MDLLKVTNFAIDDGFGAQYRLAIAALFYAEYNELEFVYTPFEKMQHNYDNDPLYLEKKENLINFIGNFEVDYDAGNIITPPSLELKVTPNTSNPVTYKMLITIFAG